MVSPLSTISRVCDAVLGVILNVRSRPLTALSTMPERLAFSARFSGKVKLYTGVWLLRAGRRSITSSFEPSTRVHTLLLNEVAKRIRLPSLTEASFTQQVTFIFWPLRSPRFQELTGEMNSLILPSAVVSTNAQNILFFVSKEFTRTTKGIPGSTFTASVSRPTVPPVSVIFHCDGYAAVSTGSIMSK